MTGIIGLVVIGALRRFTRIKEDAASASCSASSSPLASLSSMIQRIGGGSRAGLDSFILGTAATMNQDDVRLIGLWPSRRWLCCFCSTRNSSSWPSTRASARVQGWPARRPRPRHDGAGRPGVAIGLPAVGVVMMAALLILPAAAARFWTDRLGALLVLAGLFGMTMGVRDTAESGPGQGPARRT